MELSPQIVGIAASVFTGSALLPQVKTVYRDRDVKAVSIPVLCMLLAGCLLWVWYGLVRKDVIIIASNSFSLAVNLTIWVGWFLHRPPGENRKKRRKYRASSRKQKAGDFE